MTQTEYNLSFYVILTLTIVLLRIKYIRRPVRGFNTLMHEWAHALMSLLTQGEVKEIRLFRDTSGHTLSNHRNRFGAILTAIAGYPLPVIFGLIMFKFSSIGWDRTVLWVLLSVAMINLVFFIRNTYGIIWILVFMAINTVLLYYDTPIVSRIYIHFLCFILFSSGLTDIFHLLAVAIRQPEKAGDAAVLRKLTGLPALFWALFFLLLNSGLVLYVVLTEFPFIKTLEII